jgi:DNA-binding CsgD family transcriptional regulator
MSVTTQELRSALDVLHTLGGACTGSGAFARSGVSLLPRLIPADVTTLSICDLAGGRRRVVTDQPGAISRHALAAFDRHFHEHPLVREHGRNAAATTRRISDLVAPGDFRSSGLYNDYYRAVRIEHVMAVPIHVDGRFLVSFVLNRSGRDFSDHERDLGEMLRPHLANFYRLGRALERPGDGADAAAGETAQEALTPREREVLAWVAAGKTNRDIGAILGASARTVEKHLERVYEKLGVETRTAAAMRWRNLRQP